MLVPMFPQPPPQLFNPLNDGRVATWGTASDLASHTLQGCRWELADRACERSAFRLRDYYGQAWHLSTRQAGQNSPNPTAQVPGSLHSRWLQAKQYAQSLRSRAYARRAVLTLSLSAECRLALHSSRNPSSLVRERA